TGSHQPSQPLRSGFAPAFAPRAGAAHPRRRSRAAWRGPRGNVTTANRRGSLRHRGCAVQGGSLALTLRGLRVRHTLRSVPPAPPPVLPATTAPAGLSQSFQQVDHLGLEVAAAPGGNLLISSGTLTLSTLPASASVVRARLYTGQVNNGTGLDAIFGGTSLGSVTPAASDGTALRF